jgi:hypothetical protein
MLRISGAIPLLPPNAFTVWTGTTSPFTFLWPTTILISTLLHTNASEKRVHLTGHVQPPPPKWRGGGDKTKFINLLQTDLIHYCNQKTGKCSGVLQCSDGLSNKVSNIVTKLMDNIKLLLMCILRVLLSHSFIFFRFYFLSMYIWFYSCLIM